MYCHFCLWLIVQIKSSVYSDDLERIIISLATKLFYRQYLRILSKLSCLFDLLSLVIYEHIRLTTHIQGWLFDMYVPFFVTNVVDDKATACQQGISNDCSSTYHIFILSSAVPQRFSLCAQYFQGGWVVGTQPLWDLEARDQLRVDEVYAWGCVCLELLDAKHHHYLATSDTWTCVVKGSICNCMWCSSKWQSLRMDDRL